MSQEHQEEDMEASEENQNIKMDSFELDPWTNDQEESETILEEAYATKVTKSSGLKSKKKKQEPNCLSRNKNVLGIMIFLAFIFLCGTTAIIVVVFNNQGEREGEIIGQVLRFEKTIAEEADDTIKFVPYYNDGKGTRLTFKEMIQAMKSGSSILHDFLFILRRGVGYEEYYFECPFIKGNDLETKAFEFILKKTTNIGSRQATRLSFADQIAQSPKCQVATFKYGSSTFIAPCPPKEVEDDYNFSHLASFMRRSGEFKDKRINQELWRQTGVALEKLLEQNPGQKLYLSTSGDDIAWLHIRIDDRPRFYDFGPYRE